MTANKQYPDYKTMHYSDLMVAYLDALADGDGYAKAQIEREINKRNKEVK